MALFDVLRRFKWFSSGVAWDRGRNDCCASSALGFLAKGFSLEHSFHLSLGTAMSIIVLTSMSSAFSHHCRGAVRWDLLCFLLIGVLFGTFLGALVASLIPAASLMVIFSLIAYLTVLQMLIGMKSVHREVRSISPLKLVISGGAIGSVSSLVATGGGSLTVPFLVFNGVTMYAAIGTAAALGFPIAVVGTLEYIFTGLGVNASLPAHSLGYVYLPAFFLLLR